MAITIIPHTILTAENSPILTKNIVSPKKLFVLH